VITVIVRLGCWVLSTDAIFGSACNKAIDDVNQAHLRELIYCRDALDAATEADALALITEWNEFRA
jgi:hypothetical protein